MKPEKVDNYSYGYSDLHLGNNINWGANFFTFPCVIRGPFAIVVEPNKVLGFQQDQLFLKKAINLSSGWHHIAMTINNRKPLLYVDGVWVSSDLDSSFPKISLQNPIICGTIRDGQNPVANQRYKGSLDEMMLFNRCLTPSEIAALYSCAKPDSIQPPKLGAVSYSSEGLVAYWPFDGTGSDLSPNGYNIAENGITWQPGVSNNCAFFDGASNFSQPDGMSVQDAATVAFWCLPEKLKTDATAIPIGDVSWGYSFNDFSLVLRGILDISVETHRLCIFYNDRCYYEFDKILGDKWHHYAIVLKNGCSPVLFVDGIKQQANGVGVLPSFTIKNANIGGVLRTGQNPVGDQRFQGYLDEVFIYSRALSEDEIQSLCITEANPEQPD